MAPYWCATTMSGGTAAATRTGWPGHAIPLGARIIAVADSIDAMMSSRSYRPAMTSSGLPPRDREKAAVSCMIHRSWPPPRWNYWDELVSRYAGADTPPHTLL